jgi:hypothetical protein
MIISDLEHLEIVSPETKTEELKQVNGGLGGLFDISAFALSSVQAESLAISLVKVKTVAVALAPSFGR